ncbi:hypothetical protein TcBrA4_0067780 [Trypanosoma cruzi]|nr:hypothetical protein TcBrA4_0067780 [Trypanosoma cruzi]
MSSARLPPCSAKSLEAEDLDGQLWRGRTATNRKQTTGGCRWCGRTPHNRNAKNSHGNASSSRWERHSSPQRGLERDTAHRSRFRHRPRGPGRSRLPAVPARRRANEHPQTVPQPGPETKAPPQSPCCDKRAGNAGGLAPNFWFGRPDRKKDTAEETRTGRPRARVPKTPSRNRRKRDVNNGCGRTIGVRPPRKRTSPGEDTPMGSPAVGHRVKHAVFGATAMTDEPEIAKASQREPCHEKCRRLLHRRLCRRLGKNTA